MITLPTKQYIDSNMRYLDLGSVRDTAGSNIAEKFCNKILTLPFEEKMAISGKSFSGSFQDSMVYGFNMIYLHAGKGYLGAIIYTYYNSDCYYASVADGTIGYKLLLSI